MVTNEMVFAAQEKRNEKQKEKKALEEGLYAEIASYEGIQGSANITTGNMMNYIWLQNLVEEHEHVNKLHLARPNSLRCFADADDKSCGTNAGSGTSFVCAQSSCIVQVSGNNLKAEDRARLATDATCVTKHTGTSDTYTAESGSFMTKKVFNFGAVSAGAAYLCYCSYEEHAQGCGHALLGVSLPDGLTPAYESLGSLTVS